VAKERTTAKLCVLFEHRVQPCMKIGLLFVHFGVSVVHIANDISHKLWNKMHLKLWIMN